MASRGRGTPRTKASGGALRVQTECVAEGLSLGRGAPHEDLAVVAHSARVVGAARDSDDPQVAQVAHLPYEGQQMPY
eukprot:388927-Prymnesium_polylepis.1